MRCGACGRRLESSWANGRPAYRCRHGYASAARPDPARPKNLYVREDQILPHLAALAILLHCHDHAAGRQRTAASQVTTPERCEALIDHLRTTGRTLTYDPNNRILRADTGEAVAITSARSH